MYAITGISGKVGSAVARALLAAGQPVRAVLRNPDKAKRWSDLGCDVAIAEMADAAALTAAFAGATAVFILPPSNFDPSPGFPEAQAVIFAVTRALRASTPAPARVVCLSTIGAQAPQLNLLTQLTMMEQALSTESCPVTFLRPAWFMENSEWDMARAKEQGVLCSFLQPLDKAVPMVATADVGRVAAELLQQTWIGKRVIELEGPRGVSQTEIASALSRLLGRPVRAEAVPRERWGTIFKSQGMHNPIPRIQMLDGFNEGWIRFEGSPATLVRGTVTISDVLHSLVVAGNGGGER